LRDHPLVHSPLALDLTKKTAIDTPEAFRPAIREPKIDVLPLVRDLTASHEPGWCTYTYECDEAPELEVICGGVNSKTPRAGAVWRQGHLLHFGFSPSPEQMNEAGQRLLINAIAYIARFTEDRPLVRTPCGFVGDHWITSREVVRRILGDTKRELSDLHYYLEKETYAPLAGKDRDQVSAWFQRVGGYLHADAKGVLTVDTDAEKFGIPPSSPDFFEKAITALDEPERRALARQLWGRYIPEAPGGDASAEVWRSWAKENRPYLFFSDMGGYRWYIDPLAKRKGIPTAKLRGPARATLPVVERRAD
jgi:hypothetical protein